MSNKGKTDFVWLGALGLSLVIGLQAPNAWGQAATDLICSGCVQGTDIQDATIGPNKLIPGSINASTIANQSIGPNKLIPGSINASTIANRSIGPNKLILGSINTSVIATGAVIGSKIANRAVGLRHLSLQVLDQLDGTATSTSVDCGVGGSVQNAVDAVVRGQPTTIFVSGTCVENVIIRKDDIVLSGNQAAVACNIGNPSLSASATINGTITITGVRAQIEHLIVTGPGDGVDIIDRASVHLVCNDIVSNLVTGVAVLRSSNAVLRNNTVRLNDGQGIEVARNSSAQITRGTISDNLGEGMTVCCGGSAEISDATSIVNNGGTGLEVFAAASLEMVSTTITDNAGRGVSVEGSSVASIGDEDGFPGDVMISGNGASVQIEGYSVVELSNTTIQNNNGFSAISMFSGRLVLIGGNTITNPNNNPGNTDYAIFVSDGTINEFVGDAASSITGSGAAEDVAIGMFGLNSLRLNHSSVNSGAAGRAVELNDKAVGSIQGAATVTGGVECAGIHVEFFDNTVGGIDATISCP